MCIPETPYCLLLNPASAVCKRNLFLVVLSGGIPQTAKDISGRFFCG